MCEKTRDAAAQPVSCRFLGGGMLQKAEKALAKPGRGCYNQKRMPAGVPCEKNIDGRGFFPSLDRGQEMKKDAGAAAGFAGAAVLLFVLAAASGGGFHAPGPGLIAGWIVTAALLIAAAAVRFRTVPGFSMAPGRAQLCLEQLAAMADGLGRGVLAVGRALLAFGKGFFRMLTGIPAAVVKLARKLASIRLTAREKRDIAVWLALVAVLLVLSVLTGGHGEHEEIQGAMRDAVLHDENRILLPGGMAVNPGLIAAFTVSAILLIFAALVRILAVPRFREVPGKLQMLLETAVGALDGLAGVREPGRLSFVGAYVFAAGAYIFVGTLFELFGLQVPASWTTSGRSLTLPAPLSDVNGAICMGCFTYLCIMGGGIAHRGFAGAKAALKEFSLPISMSFRLFGALLSGLLVTDLVYHYTALSYGLPVVVGVMFTLLHALIQTYVLTMLMGIYYGEVTETHAE